MKQKLATIIQPTAKIENNCHATCLDVAFDLHDSVFQNQFQIFVGELKIYDQQNKLIRAYSIKNNGHAWIILSDNDKKYLIDYSFMPAYKTDQFIEEISLQSGGVFKIPHGDYVFEYSNGQITSKHDLASYL